MNEVVNLGNEKVCVIEWKGQKVITTALLAEVYEANEQQIQQNFNNHKQNFVEGKHYYFLQGDDLKAFKNHFDNIEVVRKNASQLYLWTERGANRHCKILDTDKAWEQFDNLEEIYFKVKESSKEVPKDFASALRLAADEYERRIEAEQKNSILSAENDLLAQKNLEWADRAVVNAMVRAYGYGIGGDYRKAWRDFKKELLYRHGININARITNYLNRTEKRTKPKTLDVLDDSELSSALSTITAMCRENDIDISDIIQKKVG